MARWQAGSGFSSCKPGDTAITRIRDGRIGRVERGVHDRGGVPTDERIDRREHALEDWEVLTDALVGALAQRGLVNVDELRRGIESIPPAEYERASYYERWLLSIETILTEKGVLAPGELDRWAAR
jgi:nitrile hydratase subunit beta